MGLKFDPVGGGQFKQALNAIIEAEKQPIKSLNDRKQREEAKLKLFGEFKGKFSALQGTLNSMIGFNKFKELKAELGDGTALMGVSIDKEKANVGSWNVEVKELAERSSMMSNGFSDPNKKVLGLGYITFDTPKGQQEVYVTQDDASLYGIANKINALPESSVKATVLKDVTDSDKPYRLVLSSKQDGLENEVKFPQLYFVDGEEDFYIDQDKGSKNALLSVDGFEVELGSNDVPDFLQGVGVQLKQAKPGTPFTFSIKADYAKVTDKMKKIVEGMNGVLDFVNKQNQVDEKSDTRTTFAGDTSLQNIEFRLRNLTHEGFAAHLSSEELFKVYHLSELGIEFDKKGVISFKEEKFTKALEKDFEGVSEAISGEKGFASQLKSVMDGFSAPGTGVLSSRESGLKTRIKQIDDNIGRKEMALDKKTQSLTDQFSRLQGSLANMQRQQQYLAASLPGAGSGNLTSQLLGG
ncbi:MAG: flagellar filament capping protein FliD [Bdellovibrionales bacterium]|nr:flagellar filament capping protein FliD [Bdellovibrionales bacterium]